MRKTLAALLALGGFAAGAASAAAQAYPGRSITFIVPSAPGGVTDALGRALARHFSAAWGQQAIVENRPGANNQIAAEFVAKAAPDGHVLFVAPEVTFTVNPSLYSRLNYDPVKDFTPITGLVVINHALVLNPSVAAQSVKDLIELAKQRPGQLNYGTFGIGSSGHLNAEMFQTLAGVKFQPVHYKGATPALTDVVAGHIQFMFLSIGSAVPQWKSDKVKVIALAAGKRIAQFPELPTVAESGLPGYQAQSWWGLYGPAGMPPEIVAKINAEVRSLFAQPDFQQKFVQPQYFEPIVGSPEQLAEFMRAEESRWRKVIQDAGVRAVN